MLTSTSVRLACAALATLLACRGARAQCPLQFDVASNAAGGVSVSLGDADGDSQLDVAVISQTSGNLRVLKGLGSGAFGTELLNTTLNGTCCGASVKLVDVSGDERPDLVTVRRGQGVAVLINNGTGVFGAPAYYDVANIPDTPVFDVGPLTNAGRADIAVPTGDGVAILLNDGTGVFQAPLLVGQGQGVSARAAQIFDARSAGAWGVAVNAQGGRLITGNGLGNFALFGASFDWGAGAQGLVVADLNGDGLPDIVREEAGGGVSVSLYTGGQTFGPKRTFAGPPASWYLKAADFNNDGKVDILSVAFGAGGLWTYLGRGDGTLATPQRVDDGSLEPSVGDLNGDLQPDVVLPSKTYLQVTASPDLDPLPTPPSLNGAVRAVLPLDAGGDFVAANSTAIAGSFTKFGVTPMARVTLTDGTQFFQMGTGLNNTVNALVQFDLDAGGPNAAFLVAAGAFSKSGPTGLPRIAWFDGKFWTPLGPRPIVPAAAEFAEGTGIGNWGVNSTGLVCQELFRPADLPNLRPGDIIRGIAFRLDGGRPNFPTTDLVWPRFDIKVGVGVADLGTTFAKNFVGKATQVRKGPLTMFSNSYGGGQTPNPFGVEIFFDKPVTYKGGNLLIETRTVAPADSLVIDALGSQQTTGQSRFALSAGNATGADLLEAPPGSPSSTNWAIRFVVQPGASSGFNGTVNALVQGVFVGATARGADPVLIAGGAFTKSNTTTVNRVARWDGKVWVPLGAGFNGAVNALAIFDADGQGADAPVLVAAGAFTKSGATPLNRIAYFDGSAWQPLGAGFNSTVNALAVHDFGLGGEQLVAAGAFAKSGAAVVNRVARFDGLAWQPLGNGFKGTVNTLLSRAINEHTPPTLIAGGAFTRSGDDTINRLAAWVGDRWAPLGDGPAGTVRALNVSTVAAASGDAPMFVGGDFKRVNGVAQPFFTHFACPVQQPLLRRAHGPSGSVPPCSVADLAGGGPDLTRPDGQINIDDFIAFGNILEGAANLPDDDLPPEEADVPEGETALADDVIAFVQAYVEGCAP